MTVELWGRSATNVVMMATPSLLVRRPLEVRTSMAVVDSATNVVMIATPSLRVRRPIEVVASMADVELSSGRSCRCGSCRCGTTTVRVLAAPRPLRLAPFSQQKKAKPSLIAVIARWSRWTCR